MARVRLADLNGPKWTSSGQNGPKWTILVHFGLANAKIQFGIRSFWPKWSFWTIVDHFGPAHFPTVPRPTPYWRAFLAVHVKELPTRKVGPKVQGSAGPRSAAGLPFPVPEILEFLAFRDLGSRGDRQICNAPETYRRLSEIFRGPQRISD